MIEEPISNRSFNCRVCLWEFKSESELNIHNYLEHMTINHAKPKKIVKDSRITQVYHTNILLADSNNLVYSKSNSQSRDEIESEVYDKFLSTESRMKKIMYKDMFCTSQDRRKQHRSP